jgi:hypothetical protein
MKMDTYKFEVKVQEDGTIRIPELAGLAHQRVDVFVVVQSTFQAEEDELKSVERFVNKWRGLLRDFDTAELRLQYLQEK